MQILNSLHGSNPTRFQLLATYGVGMAAAGLTLLSLGVSWKTAVLALLAFDWVGGIVANSAETVRDWWRSRPRMQTAFIVIHLAELPLVFWLTGGGIAFHVLALALAAKLSVFVLGWAQSPKQTTP